MSNTYELNEDIDIVSILFWGRSGSFFVGTLLDNHKNVLTLPGSYLTHFYGQGGFWSKVKNLNNFDIMLDIFCVDNEGLFDGTKDITGSNLAFLGDNKDICLKVDKEEFKLHMKEFSKKYNLLIRKLFFIAIHFSYEMALGHDVSEKTIINFQLHTPIPHRVEDFKNDFPNSKYLGTYREPIRALYSHIRHHKDKKQETNPEYQEYHTIYEGLYSWYYEHQLLGWKQVSVTYQLNMFPVKLEDLHDTPEQTVKNIAKFVDIEFTDSLLESTFCGYKYWGDTQAVQSINGFSSNHTRKSGYETCFSPHDIIVLNQLVALKHEEYAHLLNNDEYLNILQSMIQIPTKIEQDALNNSSTFQEYQKALAVSHKRMQFSLNFLKSTKEQWMLKNV